MGAPPDGGEGAGAIALALVLYIEAVEKIRRIAMPRYGRMTLPGLHSRLSDIFALCQDLRERTPMPTSRLKHRYWTTVGDNGSDPPIQVGVWGNPQDARQWASRQNEAQRQQTWGRGSAGPMTFTPRPLYNQPEPSEVILPERQWTSDDAREE